MKHTEIEAIFTAKVTEYITKGYTFNLTTMAGSQGEIGKVDLRKGNEVIRVILQNKNDYDREARVEREMVVLTVGRSTEDVIRDNRPFDTMGPTFWNNKMEVIEQRIFYQISKRANYFVEDVEAYDEMVRKQYKRCIARGGYVSRDERQLPDWAKKIAKRYIKRTTGKDRVSGKNIKVFKSEAKGRLVYDVEYFGQTYRIH